MKRSKKYRKSAEQVQRHREYLADEAFEVLKKFENAGFDETVEVAIRLGIDPKKTDQNVRGSVSLPNGIGKDVRVICFAEGDAAEAAREAGAIKVGSQDLAKEIQDGWLDFDVAVAAPDMMKHVGRLGRILGPQGKMPSPKGGTVTPDVGEAVASFKAGRIEFRSDSGASVHCPIGKRSFSNEKLRENLEAFIEHLKGMRPGQAKGAFVKKISISMSMSPSVRVAVPQAR